MSGHKVATLYLRVSLDRTGEGAAVERQEADCRDLCERHGWTVGEVFRDNSVSAVKAKRRPAFEALLESKPELIVMWSVDRLVRKGADLERLVALDVAVHSVKAGPMDLATASGRLNARLLTSVATFEGEIKAERMARATRQRVEAGIPRLAYRPFGWADRQGSALDEREAEALRQAYRDLLAGETLASIARGLNERGILTTKGNEWVPQTLRPLLLNARNAGRITYKGKDAGPSDQFPAIVSEDVFRAAERLLTSRAVGKAPGPGRSLLTGWASCSRCDETLRRGRRANKDGSAYIYYYCHKGHVAMDADFLESYVLRRAIAKVSTANEAREWTGEAAGEAVDLAALLTEARAVEDRIADLGKLYAAGTIDMGALTSGTEEGRARLAELNEAIASAGEDGAAGYVDVEALFAASEFMETDRLRTLLQRVIRKVEVSPRGKGNRAQRSEAVTLTFADGETGAGDREA